MCNLIERDFRKIFWNSHFSKQLRATTSGMTFRRLQTVNYFRKKTP